MSTTSPVQRGQRYGRLILGVFALGILGLFVGIVFEQTLAGLVVYTVAVVGGLAASVYLGQQDSVSLQDEREVDLQRRASHITFQLFGYLGLFVFIGLLLLDATGRHPLSETAQVLLYAFAVITLSWGAIYSVLRYRV